MKLQSQDQLSRLMSVNFRSVYSDREVRVRETDEAMFLRHKKRDVSAGHSLFVRLKGLVWTATEDDVRNFLSDCNIVSTELVMEQGRFSGEALVRLASVEDTVRALKHDRQYLGRRFVVIQEILEEQFRSMSIVDNIVETRDVTETKVVAKRQKLQFADNIVKISNVPDNTTAEDILVHMKKLEAEPDRIYIRRNENDKIRDVFAEASNDNFIFQALSCQNSFLNGRKINVDRAEMNTELFAKLRENQENCTEHLYRREVNGNLVTFMTREPVELSTDELVQCSPKKADQKKIKREVLVNLGPSWDRWNLNNIEAVFETSPEWKLMQTFHSLPSYEKRITDHEINENMKRFQEKYKEEMKNNPEVASNRMKDNKDVKKFEEKLTQKAEIDLKDWIVGALQGQRGLLIRSLDFKKLATIENYRAMSLLGLDIPAFSCKSIEDDHEHKLGCYQSETDLIILYPRHSTLCIRIIEVKRQFSFTWDQHTLPNTRLVTKCLEQLEKGFRFILSLIPDVSSQDLDVKLFTAFPEADCSQLFCDECKRMVIDKNDFNLSKENVFKKLHLEENSDERKPDNRLILKISSRLLGMFSLLHRQNTSLADCHKRETDEVTAVLVVIDDHIFRV